MPSPVLQFKRGALANVPGLRAGEPALTTDTFDLYVGIDSTTNNNKFFGSHRYWKKETSLTGSGVNFVEGTSNGSQYITLKAADSLSGITTFVLPTGDGTNGQVLKTDGSGNLSFGNAASVLDIAGGIGTDTIILGTDVLTFAGTASEIETTVTNNQVQFGLPDNVVVGASLTVTNNLTVTGTTTLNGSITLGDNTSDDITVGGEFVSSLIPNANDQYDLGTSSQRWRNGWFAGNLNIAGILTATQYNDLLIANKDIVTGYIDGSSETDDTANHGGLAVASNEGYPLVDLALVGYNTLPYTYKQIMWVKGGSMGAGTTDAWLFNYAVGVGSTQVPNEVVFAAGSVQISSGGTVTATTFNGSLNGNASTATYADTAGIATYAANAGISTQVKTVTASDTAGTYYVTFVDANNGSATAETVYTDDGIYYNPGANKLTTQHAEFTGTVLISGITTIGTGVGVTQFSASVSTGSSTSSVPTSSAVIDYVGTQIGNVDLTLGINADSGGPSTVNTSQTLTIAGTTSEVETSVSGQTITVGLPADVVVGTSLSSPTIKTTNLKAGDGTSALTISNSTGHVTASANLTVNGDLYVNGTTTQINTQELTVNDRTITLGIQTGATSSTTTWDLAVLMNYGDAGVAKTAGVIWDYSVERFVFSANSDNPASENNTTTPVITVATHAPIEISSLWVNDCAGQSQVISCTGNERFLENITVDAGTF